MFKLVSYMDKIIGKGRVTANSVIVYSSTLYKLMGKKKVKLSFSDSDAYPFARFLIMGMNQEEYSMFLLGKQGTTHMSLLQIANIRNQKVLGQDWTRDSKYSSMTQPLSSGRIWTNEKIIVMRDNRPSPNVVQYAISQLKQHGISDIDSYKLLYEDNSNCIHECQLQDYISGCASEFGYQTTEEIPSENSHSNKFREPNGMSQAEYNFNKRYGLGDSIKPKHNILTETAQNNVIRLTENQFKKLLSDSITRILKEISL